MELEGPMAAGGRDAFDATQWSMVLSAGRSGSGEALERLCRIYWPPVYAHLRRQRIDEHQAQDLTQEFFARLLAGNSFAGVGPENPVARGAGGDGGPTQFDPVFPESVTRGQAGGGNDPRHVDVELGGGDLTLHVGDMTGHRVGAFGRPAQVDPGTIRAHHIVPEIPGKGQRVAIGIAAHDLNAGRLSRRHGIGSAEGHVRRPITRKRAEIHDHIDPFIGRGTAAIDRRDVNVGIGVRIGAGQGGAGIVFSSGGSGCGVDEPGFRLVRLLPQDLDPFLVVLELGRRVALAIADPIVLVVPLGHSNGPGEVARGRS